MATPIRKPTGKKTFVLPPTFRMSSKQQAAVRRIETETPHNSQLPENYGIPVKMPGKEEEKEKEAKQAWQSALAVLLALPTTP